MTLMLRILMAELFDWRVMQTDPNFANYRYDLNSGGWCCWISARRGWCRIISATGIARCWLQGWPAMTRALLEAMAGIGILPPNAPAAMSETIVAMARDGFAPLRLDGPFDIGAGGLASNLKDQSQTLIGQRETFHRAAARTSCSSSARSQACICWRRG